MPNYQFKCPECDYEKEVFLPLRDHAPTLSMPCPSHGEKIFYQVFKISGAHDWGQGVFIRDVSPEGKTFYDKKSWLDYRRTHGLRDTMSYTD